MHLSEQILRFGAKWCSPCTQLSKVIADISHPQLERLKYIDIETADGSKLASTYAVRSLPTIVVFGDDGQEIDRVTTGINKDVVVKLLDQLCATS